MSLTSLLRSDSKVKAVLKEISPSKDDFVSNTKFPAFSSKAPLLVPYSVSESHDATIVGTAADYLFRFIIARQVSSNKEDAITNLVAEEGLTSLTTKRLNDLRYKAGMIFYEGISLARRYVYGEDVQLYDLALVTIRFAYLEKLFRSSELPNRPEDIIDRKDEALVMDLVSLANVFKNCFIDSGLVTSKSEVVFNPGFGKWSGICGGADADIYIDGTLYDFKCTKTIYRDWTEIGQVYGYYCLYLLCKMDEETNEVAWVKNPIHSIAIYNARHGMINRCFIDASSANKSKEALQELIKALEFDQENPKTNSAIEEKKNRLVNAIKNIGIHTTKLELRNIPITSFGQSMFHRVYGGTFFGFASMRGVVETEEGAKIIIVTDKGVKCYSRLVDFCEKFLIIYDHEQIAENKMILIPQKGYGKVMKIEKHELFTEAQILLRDKTEIVINIDTNEWYIVRRPVLQLTINKFPYILGEKAIYHSSLVSIKEFINEENKDFVVIEDPFGNEKKLSLNQAIVSLQEEKKRKDIHLVSVRTNQELTVDEKIPVGERVLYINNVDRKNPKNTEGIVIKNLEDENGIISVVICFEGGKEETFIGESYKKRCMKKSIVKTVPN